MLLATPDACPKKPAAPLMMMAIDPAKISTTTIREAIPAQRRGRGVFSSMVRFTPSMTISRKMAMARGVRMSASQTRAAALTTTAISTRALRATTGLGTAVGDFMLRLSG